MSVRLLVATDGSPHAMRAAALAARLARELREAEVILVHVGHLPTAALAGPGAGAMVDFGAIEEGLEQAGESVLARTAERLGAEVRVTRWYRTGDPANEIIKAAAEASADIIIMGSRGLGQIGGLILGSVSERVLRGVHVPVLIAR